MVTAARQLARTTSLGYVRPGYRPRGWRRRSLFILQGLPNIGPARGRALLEAFGSVAAIMTADADALAKVDGIGSGVAASILKAVGGEPGPPLEPGSGRAGRDWQTSVADGPPGLGDDEGRRGDRCRPGLSRKIPLDAVAACHHDHAYCTRIRRSREARARIHSRFGRSCRCRPRGGYARRSQPKAGYRRTAHGVLRSGHRPASRRETSGNGSGAQGPGRGRRWTQSSAGRASKLERQRTVRLP
jgi:hypothetical protein